MIEGLHVSNWWTVGLRQIALSLTDAWAIDPNIYVEAKEAADEYMEAFAYML